MVTPPPGPTLSVFWWCLQQKTQYFAVQLFVCFIYTHEITVPLASCFSPHLCVGSATCVDDGIAQLLFLLSLVIKFGRPSSRPRGWPGGFYQSHVCSWEGLSMVVGDAFAEPCSVMFSVWDSILFRFFSATLPFCLDQIAIVSLRSAGLLPDIILQNSATSWGHLGCGWKSEP